MNSSKFAARNYWHTGSVGYIAARGVRANENRDVETPRRDLIWREWTIGGFDLRIKDRQECLSYCVHSQIE